MILYIMRLDSLPIPSISISTRSPGLSQLGFKPGDLVEIEIDEITRLDHPV